ncbi:uncharacterized protein LY89DRAFT_676743 [Mollisia scopiformis]|uniref:Uncharacterized protein n=1 Tax=Mollisia scopiformis TaxID=149040 RepID=A0A132B8W3_MOLSC|nr:uncharacterized protein LY89DRAFT_676743 [Mollisia scopiformis]KUJ08850.1 hypothetical protein LY89DRAFT_676743 [Mollisia scopiformis]
MTVPSWSWHRCNCSRDCQQDSEKARGLHGHGPAWQNSARAIENASQRFLQDHLDMGRARNLISDWLKEGYMPSEGSLNVGEWGFTYTELSRTFQRKKARRQRKQEKMVDQGKIQSN